MGIDSFSELLERLAAEHAKIKHDNAKLVQEIHCLKEIAELQTFQSEEQLQGKTTIGSWERFSLAKLTKSDAHRQLDFCRRIYERRRISGSGALELIGAMFWSLSAALELVDRSSLTVTPIQHAVAAYDKLYLSAEAKQVPCMMWKQTAVALRNNIVCHAWTETGSDKSDSIEAALKEVYGARFAGEDLDLRSQLKKCIGDTISGGKSTRKNRRARGNNRSHAEAKLPAVEVRAPPASSSPVFPSMNPDAEDDHEVEEAEQAAHDTASTACSMRTFDVWEPCSGRKTEIKKVLRYIDMLRNGNSYPQEELQQLIEEVTSPHIVSALVDAACKNVANTELLEIILAFLWSIKWSKVAWTASSRFPKEMKLLLSRVGAPEHAVTCFGLLGSFAAEYLEWFKDESDADEVAHEIIIILGEAMISFRDSQKVQKSGLEVLRYTLRLRSLVFGVRCCVESFATPTVLADTIRARIAEIVHVAVQCDPSFKMTAAEIFARAQPLEEALMFAGSDFADWVLKEVHFNLRIVFENLQDGVWQDDADRKNWVSDVWLHIMHSNHVASLQDFHKFVDESQWFEKVQWSREMTSRIMLKSVLVGITHGIIEPLEAINVDVMWVDDNKLASSFRAISHLHDYFLHLCPSDCLRVSTCAVAVGSNAHTKMQKFSRSALAGVLGTLNRYAGRGMAQPSDDVLNLLIDMAEYRMDCWQEEATFHHEVLWALGEIFNGESSLGQWAQRVTDIASRLSDNWRKIQEKYPEKVDKNNDVQMIIQLAEKLRAPELAHP
jgi:hypothetical protein